MASIDDIPPLAGIDFTPAKSPPRETASCNVNNRNMPASRQYEVHFHRAILLCFAFWERWLSRPTDSSWLLAQLTPMLCTRTALSQVNYHLQQLFSMYGVPSVVLIETVRSRESTTHLLVEGEAGGRRELGPRSGGANYPFIVT